MFPRTVLPATAVAALATALAGAAHADPVVRLPDAGSAPTADLPIRTARDKVVAPTVVSPAEALIRQAGGWRRAGRNDQAEGALRRALAASPNNPDVLYALADLARSRGDAMSAAMWAGRLSAARPHDPRLASLANLPAPRAASTLTPAVAQTAPVPVLPRVVSAPPAAPPLRAVEAGAPVEGGRAAEIRAAAFAALEAGDLEAAEAQFERALKIVPRDRDASGGLGVVRLRQQRFEAARVLLATAAKGQGAKDWQEAYDAAGFFSDLQKAAASRNAGKLTEAEATARRLAAKPQAYRIEAQLLLGDILAARHRPVESEAAYRAAIATAPGRTEARIGLAVALADQGRADEARLLAQQLPDADAARALTARIERDRAARLSLAGDTFGAGSALATALNADPEDPWTRYEYAKFLSAHGGQAEAAQVAAPLSGANASPEALSAGALYADSQANLEQAAALIGRIPNTRRSKDIADLAARLGTDRTLREAQRLTTQGLSTRAIVLLRGELANGTLDFGARSRLAQALYDAGDAYQAGSMALTAAQSPLPAGVRPGDAAGFLNVLAAAGQEPAAEQLLANLQATARSPDNQQAFVGLMTGYAIRKADRQRTGGDYAGAFDTLSAAFVSAPNDVGLMSALARLCQAGGLQAQASQVYDALAARRPNDPEVMLEAARAATDAQDYVKAQVRLQRALQLAPGKAENYYELGRLEKAQGHDRAAMKAFETAQNIANGQARGAAAQVGAAGIFQPGGALGPNPFSGGAGRTPAQGFGLMAGFGPQIYGQANPQPQQRAFPQPMPVAGDQGFDALPTGLYSTGLPQAPTSVPARNASLFSTSLASILPLAGPVAPVPELARADAPLSEKIGREVADLREDRAIAVQGDVMTRARSGDAGTSRLTEIQTGVTVSAPAFGGRLYGSVTPTALRAGQASGLAAAGIGTAPLEVAAGKVQTPPVPVVARSVDSSASGVGFTVGYKSDKFAGDIGVTPVGMDKTKVVGGLAWTPSVGPTTLKFGIERRPVTDSVLSYSAMKDAYSGQTWGGVTRDAITTGASYDRGQGFGAYAEATAKRFTGHGVASNSAYEVNLGGYVDAYRGEHSNLRLGVNVNTQAYEKNLRYFTLGQGGYFSPQQYVSLTFPVSYSLSGDKWKWQAKIAPGFQSYSEDATAMFPTDPTRQGKLAFAAGQSSEVAAFHPSSSRSGFGVSGEAQAEYRISPSASMGGKVSLDTFGQYNEFKLGVFLKKTFGGPQ